ncbi:polyprenol reductase 2-like [Cucurbita maxima]|uniref:Polyprenol reductase 2-like n=1 Tax=Cucurbita maxima TaxID=3661 RepID=A0A6J1I5R2_CUCMA|nr:polyprenol reductase 2-like [Cucurbita maxima]XP_022971063.1 polyprenol reductase 2-like [Cucurbita maxima]
MEIGIVWLLRAAWIAGILPILLALLPFSRLSWYRRTILEFAKRGKILQSSTKKFTVPQKFFCHFYVWAVIWTALLLGTTWMYAYVSTPLISEPFNFPAITSQLTGGSSLFSWQKSHSSRREHRFLVWKAVFLLLLMEVQVLRRLYETIYTFNYSPSARMHFFGYLTGLFFYTAAPLSLCSNCITEVYHFAANGIAQFIVKGKGQMLDVEVSLLDAVIPLANLGWRQWIGAALFFWGWIHQCHCHQILASLRIPGEQGEEYKIPHGDWFEIVSSPHYLAEIVIYGGLVVASGGEDLTIWLIFGFVVVNLALAAAETHRWYVRKFDNYPRNRFAIIPYIY